MGLSAKRLGEKIGLTAEETNTLLKEAGYQSGQAGKYVVTETGKKFVEEKSWDNGCGGWAHRGYNYNEWDESIIDKLDTSSSNLQEIRDLTSQRRKERKLQQNNYYQNRDNNRYDSETESQSNRECFSIGTAIIVVIASLLTCGLFILYKYFKNKNKDKNKKRTNI